MHRAGLKWQPRGMSIRIARNSQALIKEVAVNPIVIQPERSPI
jgi:hypothetical protein